MLFQHCYLEKKTKEGKVGRKNCFKKMTQNFDNYDESYGTCIIVVWIKHDTISEK